MTVGTPEHPLRVAIFGSGPAGFYAAEELLKQTGLSVAVDVYDRLPTPYGLVRGGVAPDHQNIKAVIKIYERCANRPGFRFLGNVSFGEQITRAEVLAHYHQALFCTGAKSDRRMGIPGEDLANSHPATIFVGWYNGHPDFVGESFDLTAERVAVIGNGNVAMDVARILAAPTAELAKTDIADYALKALEKSRVREIFLLGRRGPAQAAFTNPEIRELCELEGVDLVVQPGELELDPASQAFLAASKDPVHQRNLDILKAQIPKGDGSQSRKIRARFCVSPVEVKGRVEADGTVRVQGLRLERNRLEGDGKGGAKAVGTGAHEEIAVDLVFRSIGYKGVGLPDMPFDERAGIIPNAAGRVLDKPAGQVVPRLYVAGWIKRGPSGVIGTNKPDAIATVALMLQDAKTLAPPGGPFDPAPGAVDALLRGKGAVAISFADWKRLDQAEVARGKPAGKPREKFTTISEMLGVLRSS
jgi:ferredoxin--NADP+ reductase